MLTNDEVRYMRNVALKTMPDRAQLIRTSYGTDGAGGTIATGTTVATLPARIQSLSQQDLITYADKLGARNGYQLTVPHDADVKPRDRVRISERTFEVLAAPYRGAWEITRKVVVVEVVA